MPDTDPKSSQVRGQITKAHSPSAASDLAEAIEQTVRLWRKHHVNYDQSKYVVEQVRKSLQLAVPKTRRRTVDRLDRNEVEKLIQAGYQCASKYGLLIKTLFYTGTRVEEFLHLRVKDVFSTAILPRSTSPMPSANPPAMFLFCPAWLRNYEPI